VDLQKRRWKLTAALIVIVLIFNLVVAPIHAESDALNLTATTTTYKGWLTDMWGNLVTDSQGYYVVTISPEMVKDNKVTVDFNRYAALFLADFYNESSAVATHKLKIVNASGYEISYLDYQFTTENVLPRTNNIFRATTGTLTPALNRAYGTAYTEMMTTITSPTFRTSLCVDVKGFDGKNINLMMVNLRPINDAIMAFYGIKHSYDVTLPQMMNLDDNLRRAGYTSYANYLKRHYGVR
jgi:hypothetical protein